MSVPIGLVPRTERAGDVKGACRAVGVALELRGDPFFDGVPVVRTGVSGTTSSAVALVRLVGVGASDDAREDGVLDLFGGDDIIKRVYEYLLKT